MGDDDISEIDALRDKLSEREKNYDALAKASLESSRQPFQPSWQEGLATAGLGLLPMLLGGAFGGREGAYSGALGGNAASESYIDILKKNWALGAERDKDLAKVYADRGEDVNKENLGLQTDAALMREKARIDPEKGTTINLGDNVDKVAAGELIKRHIEASEGYESDKLMTSEVRKNIDAVLATGVKPDESWGGALLRNVGGMIDPNSAAGKLRASITASLLSRLKGLTGANPSNRDVDLMKEAQNMGNRVSISTVSEMADRVESLSQHKLMTIEKMAKGYGIPLPSLVDLNSSKKFAVDPGAVAPENIPALKQAAKANNLPTKTIVVGGVPTLVYDLGADLPIGQRYLSVE